MVEHCTQLISGIASTEDDIIQTSGPAVSYTYPAANQQRILFSNGFSIRCRRCNVTKNHTVTMNAMSGAAPFAGTWTIALNAGALGVGPAQGDISWWSL